MNWLAFLVFWAMVLFFTAIVRAVHVDYWHHGSPWLHRILFAVSLSIGSAVALVFT